MNAEEKHIKSLLENSEAAYQQGDWEAMQILLDQTSDISALPIPLIEPKQKQLNLLKIISIMSISTLLTASLLLARLTVTPGYAIKTAELKSNITTTEIPNHPPNVIQHIEENTKSPVESIKTEKKLSAEITGDLENSISSNVEPPKTTEIFNNLDKPIVDLPDSLTASDSLGYYKVVTGRYWVEDSYTYKYTDASHDIEDFWIGMHYAQQNPFNAAEWDSLGRRNQTNGFSLQFMSGNMLRGENLAIYGGLDWGMQFYGRSGKDTVIINSANLDRGLSYMRSHTNDLMMRWHIEYATKYISPYINFGVGTRIFTTGQTIKALVNSTEYESTSMHMLQTKSSALGNVSVGTRFRLSSNTHFDIRYEMYFANDKDIVNYGRSKFNGTQYNLRSSGINLGSQQFKMGFIFDLSEPEKEKVLKEEAHYEEITQELLIKESESTIIVPCDKPVKKTSKYTEEDDEEEGRQKINWYETMGDGPTHRRSGGGVPNIGSGKSSFPGVIKMPKTIGN